MTKQVRWAVERVRSRGLLNAGVSNLEAYAVMSAFIGYFETFQPRTFDREAFVKACHGDRP